MHFTLLQKLLCCADYIFRKAGGKYPFLDKGVKIYPQKKIIIRKKYCFLHKIKIMTT